MPGRAWFGISGEGGLDRHRGDTARTPASTNAGAPGLALLRLISLNAREQFFFQPCPALMELLNCRLVTSFGRVTLEKLDDVVILVTKRVEAFIRRH